MEFIGGKRYNIESKIEELSEAQVAKNNAAILAGSFMLLSLAEALLGPELAVEASKMATSHWMTESFLQGIKNVPQVTTTLMACSGAFVVKYFKRSKKFESAREELLRVCMEEDKGVTR